MLERLQTVEALYMSDFQRILVNVVLYSHPSHKK